MKQGTSQCESGRISLSMTNLLYPGPLPTFGKIASDGHGDKRVLAYTICRFDPNRKRPFTLGDLDARDFANDKELFRVLLSCGLVRELDQKEALDILYTADELKEILCKRGLPTGGSKKRVVERLIENGYKVDGRKYRHRLFRLTEQGHSLLEEMRADERSAINRAVIALKSLDYGGAISAYRDYDGKWGFAHISGKKHTIFAHYDIPGSCFRFLETYPMRELRNSEDFKKTLRACLIAGLMRGTQEQWELRQSFERVCEDKIICPNLLNLFGYTSSVKEEMRKQIDFDIGNALEYYISHVMYLCRQEG